MKTLLTTLLLLSALGVFGQAKTKPEPLPNYDFGQHISRDSAWHFPVRMTKNDANGHTHIAYVIIDSVGDYKRRGWK